MPEELGLDGVEVYTVDATGIALDMGLGSMAAPIVNTAMIGAFAAICPDVNKENVVESIRQAAPAKREKNAEAAASAHDHVRGL
jgi:Pyruvate/2-oxoacid:ferredoxin oxidoreductase gamma subunit